MRVTGPGYRSKARMSLVFSLYRLTEDSVCRDIFSVAKASETPEMRVNLKRKTIHLPGMKSPRTEELIDIHGLFTDYRSSDKRQFTVQGQS